MAATGLTHHSNLEHMKAVEGFAELREVARRYDDDRGRRYCDVFGVVTGDINITHAYPGAVTAWHAHRRQYDEWFVIKGAFKVGLAIPNDDGTYRWRFISLSQYDGKILRIPPGVLHGWRNHTREEAILMYHIWEKYNPDDPDEIRYGIEEVGADWSTPTKWLSMYRYCVWTAGISWRVKNETGYLKSTSVGSVGASVGSYRPRQCTPVRIPRRRRTEP